MSHRNTLLILALLAFMALCPPLGAQTDAVVHAEDESHTEDKPTPKRPSMAPT